MCGIVAVLRRAAMRPLPTPDELRAAVAEAESALRGIAARQPDGVGRLDVEELADALAAASRALGGLDRQLRGEPGVAALVPRPALVAELTSHLDRIGAD